MVFTSKVIFLFLGIQLTTSLRVPDTSKSKFGAVVEWDPDLELADEVANNKLELVKTKFGSLEEEKNTGPPAAFLKRGGRPVFFLHIHNAAGTFMATLANNQGEKATRGRMGHGYNLNEYDDGPCAYTNGHRTVTCKNKLEEVKTKGKTWNAIERPFLTSDMCPGDFLYATIIRPPFDLMRSTHINNHFSLKAIQNLAHPQAFGQRPHMGHAGCLPGGDGYQHFDNFMVRVLNGYEGYRLPLGHVNQTHLDRAKEVLSKFEVVLDLANLKVSDKKAIEPTLEKLGWDFSAISQIQARNTHHSAFQWSEEDAKKLSERNWADLELYNLFSSKGRKNWWDVN